MNMTIKDTPGNAVRLVAEVPRDALVSAQAIHSALRNYGLAMLACVFTTVVATPLLEHFNLPNIVMMFLLTVVVVSLWLGRRPANMGSFVRGGSFSFFFFPPRVAFTAREPPNLL